MSRKLLYIAEQPMQAELISSFLESQNVKVELEHQLLASILPIGGNIGVKIWVHEVQFDRSVQLLNEFFNR